ncbi:MAG: hypothetical protein KC433_12285 [Anaerolineales bacterium]|nr:hypothetical protein [Anaerolineales bacterium]MCB8937979.1 hypothetical protein [Ardenticatenaceae bacterium]
MSALHELKISPVRYPGGLRIVECQDCRYAFAAEFDAQGIIKLDTKESINKGDIHASHRMFQTPQIELELSMAAELDTDDNF